MIALTKADLLDDKQRAKIVKALEKASGAARLPDLARRSKKGMEPLLDAVIERLGAAAEESVRSNRPTKGRWSPL